MAPSRVAAYQWARQVKPQRRCLSRVAPSSNQQSTHVKRKNGKSREPELDVLLPSIRATGKAPLPGTTQGSRTDMANANSELPSLLSSQAFFLPSLEKPFVTRVRTPSPWKSPCSVDSTTPKVALKLPASLFQSESACDSPTKSPSKVANVFRKLLPESPRKKNVSSSKHQSKHLPKEKPLEETPKNVKRQGSRVVRHAVSFINRIGTAIGTTTALKKAPKHQTQFKSLAELRRRLLQQHHSLQKAFREMEDHNNMEQKSVSATAKDFLSSSMADEPDTSIHIEDFADAIAFFGVDFPQAQHFFKLMDQDGDGQVTFDEFKRALRDMPPGLVLLDFRDRLLSKYSSLTHGPFPDLFAATGPHDKAVEGDQSRIFTRKSFAWHLSRHGVDEHESSILFDIIDANSVGSVSKENVDEMLRDVAPSVGLEEFWYRFNIRWPDIRASASSGPEGRRRAAELLFKILPASHRGTSSHVPLGLTADAWDILCAQLDVPRANAEELFRQCSTSKAWQGCQTSLPRNPLPKNGKFVLPAFAGHLEKLQAECDLDDFFDELQLWSQTPCRKYHEGRAMP